MAIPEIISVKNVQAWVSMVSYFKKYIKSNYKSEKKSWICLLNSTANSVQFGWKLAGLAVLFSRQLPKGSHNFSNYFIMNP